MVHPRKTRAIYVKGVLLLSLAVLASILLTNGRLVPGIAQSSGKRALDNRVPAHLPIKVELKKEKEKAVEDAKNDKWLRDFELEVTNTGDKPIYFLSLILLADDVTGSSGNGMAWRLHYGRPQLGDIVTKASPDDVPIKPGETYVLGLADRLQDWERFRKRENKPDPERLILKFQLLSFGDGTGFWTNTGVPAPRPLEQKSSSGRCIPELKPPGSGGAKLGQASWSIRPAAFTTSDLPANQLLANSLSTPALVRPGTEPNPQSQLCCSGNECWRSIRMMPDIEKFPWSRCLFVEWSRGV